MTFVRGQERLLSQTVGMYLLTQLTTLGWFQVLAPYGSTGPLDLLDHVPDAHEQLKPNTMAFTEGPTTVDEEGELGASHGGLWVTPHVFFLDVYGESVGVTEALASDVRAILTGRLPGTARVQPVLDFAQSPAVPLAGHYVRFEDVEKATPEAQTYARTWRVIKTRAEHIYNAAEFELDVGP